MDVLLFGDQTADQYALLHKIVNQKSNAVLATFLERVCLALRDETRKLPRARRELIPDFLRLTELIEHYYEKGLKIPELESSLVTISQLAHFIGYFENRPSELPALTNVRAIGLCTGLLAAAAVSSARSLSELIPLAVECVRIAFRAGACAGIARDALDSTADSWSTIVTNMSETVAQSAVDEFHGSTGISSPNSAYVSAVSVAAVTISGPPSTTRRLFQDSEILSKAHRVPIPVFAPYHANHLFNSADVAKVLDEHSRQLLKQFKPAALVHSASTGKCIVADDALDLVETLLGEVMKEPVRWDNLLEEVVSDITSLSDTQCNVFAFGVTHVANSLVSALKAGGQQLIDVKDHTAWTSNAQYKGRTQTDKIAIVGMAGRFPDAANHEALWDLLMKGLDVHKEVPKDRFDAQAHYDPTGKGKNKTHTPFGCFIDEPGLFDPRFFNMSPREAAQTDPMGRLALVTAYEALEMSGYVPNRTPSTRLHRIGTFYGQTSDDWREINAAQNVDTYFITGGVRAFAPGRINYYFKFSGPSFSVDTACSSSLAAIQLACTSLWAGDCDTAVAGGLNVLTNPDIFSGLSKGQFLSKTGSCKTYDNDADGYCRGDGCASVILKRYEDAVADKDHILGSILATGTNHSAEAVSITHPHAGAQEFLYKKILAEGGRDPHEVSYVEMHGTGTQAGDGIEMTSVTNAFAPPNRRRRADQPLYLGAIKANIGHGEASSGVNALVKLLMMMRENWIPPNVGIKGVINKSFPKDLAERQVNIPTQATRLPRNGADKRLFFLNNFSAAGGNSAALIEDGDIRTAPLPKDPRTHQVLTVSARAISSLKKNINNLVEYLGSHPETDLSSLAYTTTARRIQHNYRVAFTVSSIGEVMAGLQAQLKDSYSPVPMVPTNTAFSFTGQGSQYTGLGREFYEKLKFFRDDIDCLDNLARVQGLPSFLPLLQGADVATLSPVVIQLAMSCIQVALARLWASWGVKPVAVIGHSLGEYAALHVAGVISAGDMIRLVGHRAAILVRSCTEFTHGMLAVKASEEAIEEALGPQMTEVACKNGPEETVLCGPIEEVNAANQTLASKGLKSTMLKVPFAFHSSQVEPILEPFKAIASSVVFNKPSVPVLSPLTGEVIREAGIIGPEYLARHARETVHFWSAVARGHEEGVFSEKTAWVEIGAHPVCSGMVKASLASTPTTAPSLRRGEDPWKTISSSLATLYQVGVYINFDEYHRGFNECHELLTLPTYSFDDKTYWIDYTNNWCLTKGEAPVAVAPAVPAIKAPSKLSTTSCQEIVFEELNANTGTVIFQSNLAEPQLAKVVQGHLVNDNTLCPSSLFADQALTATNYLYKQLRPSAPPTGVNVCKMEVPKPLNVKSPPPAEGEWLQIEASADMETNQATVKFRTVTPEGKTLIEHAHCIVKYEDIEGWQENWAMTSHMVKTQVDLLRQKLESGQAHKFLRGITYQLFKNFVKYSPPYRGMEQVISNASDLEACATISFQSDETDGNFVCAPYWIDSLCHLSGFVCNGTEILDNETNIYISHGWGSMRFAKSFSATKKYTSYIRMLPQPRNVYAGDVYILDGDEIVGVVGGLKFQELPRRLMNAMLPPPKAKAGAAAPGLAKPAQAAAPKASAASKLKAAAPAHKSTKAKAAPKPVGGMVTAKVMKIISEETDVDMAELVNDAAFENLGVDSLLSLTISAKLREELEFDIPTTLFTDNETVGQLKKYFSQYDGATAASDDSESDSTSEDGFGSPSANTASTPPSSPPSVSDAEEKEGDVPSGATSLARQIVAEEMGVGISEIGDQADLADMGMDSLMSLTILSSLREQTGVDLPSTFLVTNNSIEEIENALGMRPKPKPKAAPAPAAPRPQAKSKDPKLDAVSAKLKFHKRDVSMYPKATSILLQGSPKTATKSLFLLPDGSGSATSYMNIPNMGKDIALFAMNCPFMKTPDKWTTDVGLDGICAIYINEMKRRQPEGPYFIGGWSAGGVAAYETCRQLLAAGDKVAKLVLIDAPSPSMAQEPLPPGTHLFFDEIGLLGSGGKGSAPAWLLDHFAAAIRNLSSYEAPPLPPGLVPDTWAIWAREGIAGNPGDPRPPPVQGREPRPLTWLLNHRKDLGGNGWEEYVGSIRCEAMDGNHFSMVAPELAGELGRLIRKTLEA